MDGQVINMVGARGAWGKEEVSVDCHPLETEGLAGCRIDGWRRVSGCPLKAGIHESVAFGMLWIPAFAGMTVRVKGLSTRL